MEKAPYGSTGITYSLRTGARDATDCATCN